MWTLLDHVDLVETVSDWLRHPPPWVGDLTAPEPNLLCFHDADSGPNGELPADALCALRTAGLTALAARLLLTPSAVTAGVMGSRPAAQWHVGVLGRYVPNVCHVALFTTDRAGSARIDAHVLDQLDLDGVGLSPAASAADAVLGATLVVTLGQASQLRYDHVTRGAVLVTTDDRVVSTDLREGIARRYAVDDLLGVLLGERPGRTEWDEILLVDLPDNGRCRELDAVLAHRFVQSASRLGVGVNTRNGASS
jgi:ornithine cyclodeaminase/alanine dehydrogenase-like protein (mu-crystallin family)